MQGYHTTWGRNPALYEIISQIASAAAWRHHCGPIDLYTDSIGKARVIKFGFEKLYNQIHLLPPDTYRLSEVCWAWNKLEAMLMAKGESCSVDTDCIVLTPY